MDSSKKKATPRKATQPSKPDNSWILEGLNKLDRKVEEHEKDMKKLIDQTARLEENIKSIPEMKTDIKNMTRNYWIAFGIFIVLVFLARIALPDFDITLTAK